MQEQSFELKNLHNFIHYSCCHITNGFKFILANETSTMNLGLLLRRVTIALAVSRFPICFCVCVLDCSPSPAQRG